MVIETSTPNLSNSAPSPEGFIVKDEADWFRQNALLKSIEGPAIQQSNEKSEFSITGMEA